MFSEELLIQFDSFCAEFSANTNIDSYNSLEAYSNCLGDNGEFAFENWDESQDLRTRFENWIEEHFPGLVVDCAFSTQSLSTYKKIDERTKCEKSTCSENSN